MRTFDLFTPLARCVDKIWIHVTIRYSTDKENSPQDGGDDVEFEKSVFGPTDLWTPLKIFALGETTYLHSLNLEISHCRNVFLVLFLSVAVRSCKALPVGGAKRVNCTQQFGCTWRAVAVSPFFMEGSHSSSMMNTPSITWKPAGERNTCIKNLRWY